MDPLIWAALLMFLGLALVLLEIFVPSGGVLGFLSIGTILASIVIAFYQRGAEVGFIFLLIAAVAVPTTLVFGFRWWPHTPMGKRLLLDAPTAEEVLPDTPIKRLRELVGKTGLAKTVMLPAGAIEVDGQTIDAISAGMPIEVGQHVRIVDVRGNRVVVQPADAPHTVAQTDDILSQPIESLGLSPFDEPLS
jgi:membrane-bound serine protease (ClpP class)